MKSLCLTSCGGGAEDCCFKLVLGFATSVKRQSLPAIWASPCAGNTVHIKLYFFSGANVTPKYLLGPIGLAHLCRRGAFQ